MKSFYFLFVCLVYSSTSLFAQEDVLRYPIPEGGQPFDYKYPKASKVHYKKHNRFNILNEWDKYYDYSKDSLSITVKAPWGIQYVKYNLDGTMASYSSPVNNWNGTYTYTEEGNILKIESKTNEGNDSHYSLFNYANATVTRTNYIYSEVYNKFFITSRDIIEYNKEFIKYTTQLYNIDTNNWENEQGYNVYKLDVYGRVIEGGWYDEKGEYHIDVQYSYTNNGYIEYSKFNGHNYAIREFTFNNQDDLIKEVWYNWNEDGRKDLVSITEYTYTYPNPTSNENIKQQNYKVYSTENGLVIENNIRDSNIKASIYAITGQLLRTISISDNRTEIPLSPGIYIVVIDNRSYKVKVK